MSDYKELTILPVRKQAEEEDDLNPVLPRHAFLMLLIAPPRAGKSNLIANLLCNPAFYYNKKDPLNPSYFSEIFYFSPTSKFDATTKMYLKKLNNAIQIHEPGELEHMDTYMNEIMRTQAEWNEDDPEPRKKILFVIDDCLGIIERNKGIASLATKYRHYSISIIVTSQSWRRLPSTIRNCATCLIFFNLVSHKEYIKLYEEHCQSVPMYWDLLPLLDRKYQFFYYHLEKQELYHNFDKLLFSKDEWLDAGNDMSKKLLANKDGKVPEDPAAAAMETAKNKNKMSV